VPSASEGRWRFIPPIFLNPSVKDKFAEEASHFASMDAQLSAIPIEEFVYQFLTRALIEPGFDLYKNPFLKGYSVCSSTEGYCL